MARALSDSGVGFDSWLRAVRMNLIQGNSQRELAMPSTMKKSLQPTRAMSMPPRSVPKAGPKACPAEMSELARPR